MRLEGDDVRTGVLEGCRILHVAREREERLRGEGDEGAEAVGRGAERARDRQEYEGGLYGEDGCRGLETTVESER